MRIPKLRKNGDGRAFVEFKGKRTYLGEYGSDEAERKYRDFLARMLGVDPSPAPEPTATVSSLMFRYLEFARSHYSRDGKPSKEFKNVEHAIRPLLTLCPALQGREFGARRLIEVREKLIEAGYARTVINFRIGRIRRAFRWLCQHEFLPVTVYQSLMTVEGLRLGRSGVRESQHVRPVPRAVVDATLPFVPPPVAAMIQVQYLCGMRPTEVCIMRAQDIDVTDEIWLYRPASHKNQWRNGGCVKAIPKAAQAILKPLLKRYPDGYLFRPMDAVEWAAKRRMEAKPRVVPTYPCELKRREKARRNRGQKAKRVRDHYDSPSYYTAIKRSFERAKSAGVEIPHWHPHQLRHTIADEVRSALGPDAAQLWLWHERISTTELYTSKRVTELQAVARALDAKWAG